jgi:hypothetical protein
VQKDFHDVRPNDERPSIYGCRSTYATKKPFQIIVLITAQASIFSVFVHLIAQMKKVA